MNIALKRSLSAIVAGSAILSSLSFAGTALAAESTNNGIARGGQNMPRPVVVGTVATVMGNTLTINAKAWQHKNKTTTTAASTVYTVDATNAVVTKAGASSTVSAITVGDQVVITGTITGTSVVATRIIDGKMSGRPEMPDRPKMGNASTSMQFLPGNGNPVIGGSVTAMSSTTLTVTAKSGTVYTVTVGTATVQKAGVGSTAATLSSIALGDTVLVQGTVQGTSVTASSIIDQGIVGSVPSISGENEGDTKSVGHQGFMGAIGGFFSHLFGFF